MTAVAPPPFQSLPKSSWSSGNGATNGFHSMNGDEGSRMLIGARKPATRSNSSSSLSSVSSNASTVSATSVNGVGATQQTNGEASRKKPTRGYVWPGMSKTEPIAGLSNGRAQPVGPVSFHNSATSSVSSLQMPLNSGPSNGSMAQSFQERPNGARPFADGTPLLCLTPMNGTFERKNLQVPFYPEVIRIGRQTNAKSAPTPLNGFFDSKVLSRQHAEIWSDPKGKIWIRDIKSSNGTFVNGQRLSDESKNSEPHELRESDMLELGIDIVSEDQKTVVHHKVAARVEHAGFATGQNLMEVFNLTNDLDPSNPNHPLNNQNHLRRNSAQGAHPTGLRGPNGVALGGVTYQRAQQPFLLGPVNIEQVIKKLSAEHKLAKAQQNELQRSAQFLDTLLSNPQTKESLPFDSKGKSSLRDVGSKGRFSDPPNPPPSAPLPEKPFDASSNGLLKRSDTEKPKTPSPPNGSFGANSAMATQFHILTEALSQANKEAEEHRKKLTDIQKELVEERMRREAAEARTKQLEKEALRPRPRPLSNGALIIPDVQDEEQSTTPIEEEANSQIAMRKDVPSESATTKLLRRLELLQAEFQEVKQSAERWRSEKEEAERQRDDEKKEKTGLMELVDKYKKEDEARRQKKEKRKQSQRASAIDEDDDDLDDGDDVELVPGTHRGHSGTIVANGTLSSSLIQGKDGGTLIHSNKLQATPYISAFSVVLLGVAIMTLVNRMSKNEQ